MVYNGFKSIHIGGVMFDKLLINPTALLAAADKAFVWQEHTREIITTALLSMVPTFEGRYAVTVALGMGMPPVFSYLLALICSSIPIPFKKFFT